MDEMVIKSSYMSRILSKIVTKFLKKKLGKEVEIQVKELKANIDNNDIHADLTVHVTMSKGSLLAILGEHGI